jgi:hypothetical protein
MADETTADPFVNKDGEMCRPFDEWFTEHRRGELNREASIALHDVIAAVISVGKKGALTIKVDVTPAGELTMIDVEVTTTAKIPQPSPPSHRYYIDRAGNPTRHDPYQQTLDVPGGDD